MSSKLLLCALLLICLFSSISGFRVYFCNFFPSNSATVSVQYEDYDNMASTKYTNPNIAYKQCYRSDTNFNNATRIRLNWVNINGLPGVANITSRASVLGTLSKDDAQNVFLIYPSSGTGPYNSMSVSMIRAPTDLGNKQGIFNVHCAASTLVVATNIQYLLAEYCEGACPMPQTVVNDGVQYTGFQYILEKDILDLPTGGPNQGSVVFQNPAGGNFAQNTHFDADNLRGGATYNIMTGGGPENIAVTNVYIFNSAIHFGAANHTNSISILAILVTLFVAMVNVKF